MGKPVLLEWPHSRTNGVAAVAQPLELGRRPAGAVSDTTAPGLLEQIAGALLGLAAGELTATLRSGRPAFLADQALTVAHIYAEGYTLTSAADALADWWSTKPTRCRRGHRGSPALVRHRW